MNYWIFKCNPKYYRLDDRLNDSEEKTTWRIKQHKGKVKQGDIAFIWETGRDRGTWGIRATLQIDSAPVEMDELEAEKKYYIEPDFQPTPMVRVRATFRDRFTRVSAQDLMDIPQLAGLSVFRGPHQATNFEVTNDEGQFLLNYIKAQRLD